MLNDIKSFTAELIGTFFTVFIGCSVAALTIDTSIFIFATALAFAISYFAMYYFLGKFTDCHLNPALSLAMFIGKKITAIQMAFYMVGQLTGAIIGGLLVALVTLDFGNLGQNVLYAGKSGGILAGAFFVEIILAFVFVLFFIIIKNREKDKGTKQGVMISFSLFTVYLISVAICGGSLNPAKGFAMAILSAGKDLTSLAQIWIWLVAPFIGAAGAAFAYMFLSKHGAKIFELLNKNKRGNSEIASDIEMGEVTEMIAENDTVSFDTETNADSDEKLYATDESCDK